MSDEAPIDRRASARTRTGRRVLFFSAHAEFPREGWVQDIGLSGVAVRTSAPPPVGTQVDLEIQSKPGHPEREAIFVRGDVVRVVPASARDYLMAVHLRVAPPDADTYRAEGVDIVALIASTRRELESQAGISDPVAIEEYRRQEAVESTPEQEPRKRRWPLLLLLLLFLPALVWWLISSQGIPPATDGGPDGETQPSITDGPMPTPEMQVSELVARAMPYVAQPTRDDVSTADASLSNAKPLDSVSAAEVSMGREGSGTAAALADGGASLEAGDWVAAAAAFESVAGSGDASPVERVQARLGLAHAAWQQERYDEARAVVDAALGQEGALPPEWREAAESLAAAVEGVPASIDDHVLRDVAELALVEGHPSPGPDGMRLVIDKSEFLLSVIKGDEEQRRFPVGLGFAGSTPEGTFVIANMLVDPTWFNRGEAVPPDDPRNPLGSRWMGLGRRGKPTAYGIHGTVEPESIGREVSRGCIRMRSADAEALFALCSVGTPVTIVP